MIPWELFSYRLFKTVIFLMLLLCCLVLSTESRPLDAETPADWNSKEERLENKPKINSSSIYTENQEFGSKTANKSSGMVVRVIVSSSSSSSSDSEGEFSGFPAFQFVSPSTSTEKGSNSSSSTTSSTISNKVTATTTRPEVNRSVVRGQAYGHGQNSRYFLRPKRISTFTAKTAASTPQSTTTTITTTAKTDLSTSSVSIEEEIENQEKDSERLVKTKKTSEDIFSAFYHVFSKSNARNRSSSSLSERESVREKDDSLNDNDNSPVMSDSQNVERFQVYPQLIRSRIDLASFNSNRKSSNNNKKTLVVDVDSNNNNKSETLDRRGFVGPEAKVVSVVTHTKSVAVNTHRSSKHVITNSRPLPVRARPIYQPKPAETAIEAVTVATLKNSSAQRKSGLSPIITSNSSPRPRSNNVSPIAQALIQDSPIYNPIAYTRITTNTPTSQTSPSTDTSTTQKSTTPKITTTTQKSSSISWHQPEKIWGEPAQIWGSPGKIWGEPEKVWGEPAKIWSEPSQPSWLQPDPSLRFRGGITSTESTVIPSSTLQSLAENPKNKKAITSLEDEEEDDEEKNSRASFFQLGEDDDEEMENEGGKNSWELPELSPQVDHTFVGGRVSIPSLNHNNNHNNNNNKPSSSNSYTNSNTKQSISSSTNNENANSRRTSSSSSTVSRNSNSRDSSSAVDAEKEKSGKKFGYVLEGADVRKYRVEERTPDGYIVGEYGVLNNENGFLRGVRYTADGTINPRLIHEALMKFLAL